MGLYRNEDGFKLLAASPTRVSCLNAEHLRELCWSIFSHSQNRGSCESLAAMITAYFSLHDKCLMSLTKDGCPFYFDTSNLFARSLSPNQVLSTHRWFEEMKSNLTVTDSERLGSVQSNDNLHSILRDIFARPLLQKFQGTLFIRVTMQFSGNSQLEGTKMMDLLEERFLELVQGKLTVERWAC